MLTIDDFAGFEVRNQIAYNKGNKIVMISSPGKPIRYEVKLNKVYETEIFHTEDIYQAIEYYNDGA